MKLRLSFSSGFINSECSDELELDELLTEEEAEIVEKAVREGKEEEIPDYITKLFEDSLSQFLWDRSDASWNITE